CDELAIESGTRQRRSIARRPLRHRDSLRLRAGRIERRPAPATFGPPEISARWPHTAPGLRSWRARSTGIPQMRARRERLDSPPADEIEPHAARIPVAGASPDTGTFWAARGAS